MSEQNHYIYEFGPARLDAQKRLLVREGAPVKLFPKEFDTLLALVEHSGEVLDKDELMQRVWPDAIVEEGNLTTNISHLRKALDEKPHQHQYIVTVPGRGYRFVAGVKAVFDEVVMHERTRVSVTIEEEAEETPAASGRGIKNLSRKIKSHRRAVGLAMAALTIAASAVFYFRFSYQPAPALTDRDTILLADFVNTTGDVAFDETLKQALAVHLEQSPFLNLLPDERVRETLRYMNRSPDEIVTKKVAREICERQNLKAVLVGAIASLGKHYVITLEAAHGLTGEVIAREQVEVESKEQVLRALGQAAFRLREKLGESLRSIQRFNTPVEQATTPSLEALKAYSLGLQQTRRSQWREATPFLKRAVELDPDFAIAYSELALAYRNSMGPIISKEFSRKAFELRERTTERERFEIALRYYGLVTYERDKAAEVLEVWRQTYPRDLRAQEGLANRYLQMGQPEKSLEICRELVRLHPDYSGAYSSLAIALIRLNRYAEAKEVLEGAMARGLGWRSIHFYLYQIAFVQGDAAAMKQQIDWAASQPYDYDALTWPADTAAVSGQMSRTHELYRRAIDLAHRRRDHEAAARLMGLYVMREATQGNCQPIIKDSAKKVIATGNYLRQAAHALALCREHDQARSLIDKLAKESADSSPFNQYWLPVIQAIIEIQRGKPDKAVEILQPVSRYEAEPLTEFWPIYLRGQAYLQQRAGGEAVAEFQKIVEHRGRATDSQLYPLAHLGVARAAALASDTARSRQAYQDFLALWKDADPGNPLLIAAKKEYEMLQ